MVEERVGAWRRLDKTHDNQMDNPVPHPSTEEVGDVGGVEEEERKACEDEGSRPGLWGWAGLREMDGREVYVGA